MEREAGLMVGSLAAFPAPEVLQWMGHHPGESRLTFTIPAGRIGLHLRDGVVLALKDEHPCAAADQTQPADQAPPGVDGDLEPREGYLGALLVAQGVIDAGPLRYGLALQQTLRSRGTPRPLGEVLRALGVLSPPALDRALRDLAYSRFVILLDCRRGIFRIERGRLTPPFLPVDERMDRFLLKAAHAADQRGAGRFPAERG